MSLIIQIPRRITREYIQRHKDYHFIYSSSYLATPSFGQSRAGDKEDNTSPIPVRFSLCASSGFFSDNIITVPTHYLTPAIDKAIEQAAGKPIIPFPRMGCGRSRMKEFAPRHWQWMMDEIDKIKYPNIEYI